MPSLKPLPAPMLADIERFLERNRTRCIPVFAEAEQLRQKWERENIALEDVLTVLVERCGAHDVAMSFDRRGETEVLLEDMDDTPRRQSV